MVSILGFEYREITCREIAGFQQIEITFANGSLARIHMQMNRKVPYFSVVSHARETHPITVSGERLFRSGLEGILGFFRNPSTAIDRRETLAIMEILETVKAYFAA